MSICNLDYINRLEQIEPTAFPTAPDSPNKTRLVVPTLILLSILTFGSVKIFSNFQSQNQQQLIAPISQDNFVAQNLATDNNESQNETSMLGQLVEDDLPLTARVAGVSTDNTHQEDQTDGFGLLEEKIQCQKQLVFSLGDVESEASAHPADEFNWVGALDVLPEYPTPFIVGINQAEEFPWRTPLPNPEPIVIKFDWSNAATLPVELSVGWRTGTQGTKAISVILNDQPANSSPTYESQLQPSNWQQMHSVESSFTLNGLVLGQNQLIVKPIINSGDPIVWDYLRLELLNCP